MCFSLDPDILFIILVDDSSSYTSPQEIKNIVKKLKNGKAPRGAGVPNILLKNIPRRATVFLTFIYNSCLKLCYFPKERKHAVVIPIPKPGKDPSNPSNYPPSVSLALLVKFSRGSFYITYICFYNPKRSSKSSI
jgi:hypothetical protein